jgi:hypothetical protein
VIVALLTYDRLMYHLSLIAELRYFRCNLLWLQLYLLKLGVVATAREEVLVKCVEYRITANSGNIGKVERGVLEWISLCTCVSILFVGL